MTKPPESNEEQVQFTLMGFERETTCCIVATGKLSAEQIEALNTINAQSTEAKRRIQLLCNIPVGELVIELLYQAAHAPDRQRAISYNANRLYMSLMQALHDGWDGCLSHNGRNDLIGAEFFIQHLTKEETTVSLAGEAFPPALAEVCREAVKNPDAQVAITPQGIIELLTFLPQFGWNQACKVLQALNNEN